jgi:hypothetical protein
VEEPIEIPSPIKEIVSEEGVQIDIEFATSSETQNGGDSQINVSGNPNTPIKPTTSAE